MNQHYSLLTYLLASWESDSNDVIIAFDSPDRFNAYTGWFGLQITATEPGCQVVGVATLAEPSRSIADPTGTIRFSPQPLTLA